MEEMLKKVNYGEYAFLGGLVIAFVIGVLLNFLPADLGPLLTAILFLLGVIVGLANIKEKEVKQFLIAALVFMYVATTWNTLVVSTLEPFGPMGTMLGEWIAGITSALVVFVSPAAFIIAFKAIYNLAQP